MLNWKKITILCIAGSCSLFSAACALLDESAVLTPEQRQEQEFNAVMSAPVEGAVSIHTILNKTDDPSRGLMFHGFYGEKITVGI